MNTSRNIFGWCMYDWANSAFVTTVTVAVLPIYFADVVVQSDGFSILGVTFSATTLWSWMIGLSALIIFLTAPVMGAISDFSAAKKKFLIAFCYMGCTATILLFFPREGDVWTTMLLFVIAQTGFVGGNVFYDAFLPQIAPDESIDWISGKGFAYGYIGGGIQFALSLLLIVGHDMVGLTSSQAARTAIMFAGLWWGGFALVTFTTLKEQPPTETLPVGYRHLPRWWAYVRVGVDRTVGTARRVRRFKHLLLFLVAFMIYNDGIQTVITMATIYGREELAFSPADLMLTLLIIQFVAFFGSLLFGRLGVLLTAKKALLITIAMWSFVVIYAYFMTRPVEYYLLGVIVGLSMGGSQALSRSLYGAMIPAKAPAEFYGFYSVFNKFSAIWGPLVFGLINALTGSSRQAILSLIVFFIVGFVLLLKVDVEKGKEMRTGDLFG